MSFFLPTSFFELFLNRNQCIMCANFRSRRIGKHFPETKTIICTVTFILSHASYISKTIKSSKTQFHSWTFFISTLCPFIRTASSSNAAQRKPRTADNYISPMFLNEIILSNRSDSGSNYKTARLPNNRSFHRIQCQIRRHLTPFMSLTRALT